jgi:hypothetical protein
MGALAEDAMTNEFETSEAEDEARVAGLIDIGQLAR